MNLSVRRTVAEAIGPRTKGIVVVHTLGNPCDMERIMPLAERHGVWLVEDCCEAMGAKIGGRHVGTYGQLATFSCFFSHHITTIEGGLVSFRDSAKWRDRLLSLRAHGWVRGRSDLEKWTKEHPDIDDRWLFVSLGFNLRPTDISAAFGLAQLRKLPGFVRKRQRVRQRLLELLAPFSPWLRFQVELPGHEHSAFGFAVLVDSAAPFSRGEFQRHLESHGIQTRPIIGSNFARQPVMRNVPYRVHGELKNADRAHFQGLMIANHHDTTASQLEYVAEVIGEFLSSRSLWQALDTTRQDKRGSRASRG
jgi:CDP-6-deoxy-D-xylo-4-hexulose-3-dehydrase